MPHRIIAFLMMIPLTAALLVFGGCAKGQMGRLMPHMENMTMARHYFGEPSSGTTLADGTVRYEWVKNEVTQVPGQTERRVIWVGHDKDGFRREWTEDVFVPEHSRRINCRLSILANPDGRVISSEWQGTGCDSLLRVPTTY